MIVAKKIRIYGLVQKVGFRHFILKFAESLEIKGYVKNEEKGNVFTYIVGEETKVNELIELCKHGPEKARVEFVEVFDAELLKFRNFEIRL